MDGSYILQYFLKAIFGDSFSMFIFTYLFKKLHWLMYMHQKFHKIWVFYLPHMVMAGSCIL